MKKNKIFYLLSLVMVMSVIISCEDDDIGPQNFLATGDATEEVNVNIELLRTISAEDDLIPATITLSRSFDVDANVVLRSNLNNLSFALNTITVPAGSTTATGFVATPAEDSFTFEDFNEQGFVTATSIGADDGNGVIYIATSNEAPFRLVNAFPSSIGVGGISFAFLWDSDDDYDIFYDNSLNQGATGNAIEFIELTNAEVSGDGVRQVLVDPFTIAGEMDIPYVLAVRISNPFGEDTLTVFEGTLDTDDTSSFVIAEVTRTTNVDTSNPDIPITTFTYEIVQIED